MPAFDLLVEIVPDANAQEKPYPFKILRGVNLAAERIPKVQWTDIGPGGYRHAAGVEDQVPVHEQDVVVP